MILHWLPGNGNKASKQFDFKYLMASGHELLIFSAIITYTFPLILQVSKQIIHQALVNTIHDVLDKSMKLHFTLCSVDRSSNSMDYYLSAVLKALRGFSFLFAIAIYNLPALFWLCRLTLWVSKCIGWITIHFHWIHDGCHLVHVSDICQIILILVYSCKKIGQFISISRKVFIYGSQCV